MRLERELERLDRRIAGIREALEVAYATRVPDERKDTLFARLDTLLCERDRLKRHWSFSAAFDRVRAAFAEMGRKIREIVRRFLPELLRLEDERKRSRPAFWRGAAQPNAGAGALGRSAFSTALPANRRPVLRGFMRQKGRG